MYWVSNLATRLEVTENSVSSFETTDTSVLQERIATLETAVEFNKKNNDKLSGLVDRNKSALTSDINNVENELSDWIESELEKLYDIVNDNPLGN